MKIFLDLYDYLRKVGPSNHQISLFERINILNLWLTCCALSNCICHFKVKKVSTTDPYLSLSRLQHIDTCSDRSFHSCEKLNLHPILKMPSISSDLLVYGRIEGQHAFVILFITSKLPAKADVDKIWNKNILASHAHTRLLLIRFHHSYYCAANRMLPVIFYLLIKSETPFSLFSLKNVAIDE